MSEKLLFEYTSEKGDDFYLPPPDVPEQKPAELIPAAWLRQDKPRIPDIAEPHVVRHFVNLSTQNHHVDKAFYPLGSCTMKYNPKINENTSALPGYSCLHPLQSLDTVQGALQLVHDISSYLAEIAGFSAVTLQPAAGAHGELTGLMLVRAFHESKGHPRKTVLIPDSAHGTNPASVIISGYESVTLKSNDKGLLDLKELEEALNPEVAALMLTNPNTLGIFETQVKEICKLCHNAGALVYMDGANMNALLGLIRPAELGIDVMHFNLHKTFSTPHGGGGPGSGPVGVVEKLVDFLPTPCVTKTASGYTLDCDRPQSIGKVSTFYGNFAIIVRAYTYIRMLGAEGLKKASQNAILNANYLLSKLSDKFDQPYDMTPMHEFVLAGTRQKQQGVKTLDIAKRLLDFGVHAPTVYFPLIVPEALMIEPTETESKETLDAYADYLLQIAREAEENPEKVKQAPTKTPLKRLDEAQAAKELNIRYNFKGAK